MHVFKGSSCQPYESFVDLVNAVHGWDLNMAWLDEMAMETIKNELKFNELAGFRDEDYRMPDIFTQKKIESTQDIFDIDSGQLDELRQWND